MRLAITFLLLLTLVGCVQVKDRPVYKFDISSEKKSELVDLSVRTIWRDVAFDFNGDTSGIGSFDLTVTNKTDKVVRVVWEKSSISYSGSSYQLFIEGQKYDEASKPMSPMVIPSRGVVGKGFHSSGQPYFESGQYGGWRIHAINASLITILLCVQSGDIEDYYTINVSK